MLEVFGYELLQLFEINPIAFGLVWRGKAHIFIGWPMIGAAVILELEISHTAILESRSATMSATRNSAGKTQFWIRRGLSESGVCSATTPSLRKSIDGIGV